MLDWYDERLMKYPSSVAVTWQTSVNQLSADARLLLDRLAWLAPDPIPESLLNVQAAEEESLDYFGAITELTGYSLVNRLDNPEFTVHRLVQDVTRRNQNTEVAENTFVTCLNWINKAFAGDPEDVRSWPVLEPLISHVLALTSNTVRQSPNSVVERRLMNNLGTIYLIKAQYEEAEPLFRRALQIDEQSLGENHPDVARDLNDLAILLKDTNQLAEAELLMRRALKIDEQNFGKDRTNVARDLNNLAQLLKETNRIEEAEPLMRRALQIDEQNFGDNHLNVARDLNNLARLLQDINRLPEAEPLMRRAFVIVNFSLGFDHPNTQTVRENYILLLQDIGKSEEETDAILSNILN